MSVQISAPQPDKALNRDFVRCVLKNGAAAEENRNFCDTRNNVPLLQLTARAELGVAVHGGDLGHDC